MNRAFQCTFFATMLLAGFQNQAMALNLIDAMHRAEMRDPRFAAIRASQRANGQNSAIARSNLLPQVNLQAAEKQNSLNQNAVTYAPGVVLGGGNTSYRTSDLSLTLSQPLFNVAAFRQYESAKASQTRDDATLRDKLQSLRLSVAEAYFGVLRAQAALDVAKSRKDNLDRQYSDAQGKFKQGVLPKLDLIESEAQRDVAMTEYLSAQNQLAAAQQNLQAFVGGATEPVDPIRADALYNAPEPHNPQQWAQLAVIANPRLIAARYDLAAFEKNEQAQKAGYLPDLSLVGNYNKRNTSGSDNLAVALNSGVSNYVGVQLNWNLFSGGRTVAQAEQALNQKEAAQANMEASQQAIQNESISLYQTVETDSQQVSAYRKALDSASRAYTAIQAGYRLGTHTILDLLAAETRQHKARLDYDNARFAYVIDSLKLHYNAGLLNDDVIARFNGLLMQQSLR